MKKMIALLMLLCVTLMPFAGLAENVITWDEVGAPVVEASELEGDFYALEDLGLAIWLPEGLYSVELDDESIANGILYMLTDEEVSCALTISYVNEEGMTLDKLLAAAVEEGMFEPEIVNINGLDALSYKDEANNLGCIALVDTNCNVIVFSLTPIDSEDAELVFGLIMSSLMPLE